MFLHDHSIAALVEFDVVHEVPKGVVIAESATENFSVRIRREGSRYQLEVEATGQLNAPGLHVYIRSKEITDPCHHESQLGSLL